jgi:hypothetical protein
VLLGGGEVDDVSGSYLDHLLTFLLCQPFTGYYVEDLTLRMRVPQLVRAPGSKNTRKMPASGDEPAAASIHTTPVNHSSGPRRISEFRVETTFMVPPFGRR